MKRLVIYGTRHLDVIKLIEAINRATPTWEILGFINDIPEEQKKTFAGFRVLGGKEVIPRWASEKDVAFLNNINSSITNHRKIAAILESHPCRIANLIHPAVDMNRVECREGAIIPEGCVVGGNVRIGRYFTCRLKSLLSHDMTIGDFVYVGPSVTCCGGSSLGDGCFIGAGAVISTGVKIGAGAVIGAGSLVVKDVPDGVLAYGSPAKVVREASPDETIV